MAKDFASLWKGKDPLEIEERMQELHNFTAYNYTVKSAFDMALYDLAAKSAAQPLFQYLGGRKKRMETDLTIGIGSAEAMAEMAKDFKARGVHIIKIKLGKEGKEDVERVRQIRKAVGEEMTLRIDANQGWDFDTAAFALKALADYNIEFCEQPLRYWNDGLLPKLKQLSPIPIMADESVFTHHDAKRIIDSDGCDYVNIKFSKSGGILEAKKINEVAAERGIPCMMGGMLESRVALSAFAHFASATDNIIFYDMDTCMLGHKTDPVSGGIRFDGFNIEIPDTPGIGADVNADFLTECERVII
jgi:L-alanine-DL-glutamate epimerase-like enolase superfamily enzyme